MVERVLRGETLELQDTSVRTNMTSLRVPIEFCRVKQIESKT